MKPKILILILLAFIFTTCQKENQPPTVEITSPTEGTEFVKGEKITISADAKDGDGQIKEVRFYIDGKGVSSATGFPYTYEWPTENASVTSHTIKATAVDDGNEEAEASIVVYVNIYSPLVNTFNVKEIAQTSAICGGEVTESKGSQVKERGICWSESTTPKISDYKKTSGEGLGSFEATLEGLKQNTLYYVRAYATNDAGTSYGTQQSFTTTANQTKPTVITADVTDVTTSSAVLGGNVTSDGYADVTERGIVYATSQNPTISNSKVSIGNGTGSFSTTVSGLAANTTYYVRTFAVNSQGIVYGEEISFTTSKTMSPATVSTVLATGVTTNSAVLGGNVTSDGNLPVTERGIMYSISENLDAAIITIPVGNGTGQFSTPVNGLTADKTYYFKAYATNSLGTTYGKIESFTTNKILSLAAVTTQSASNITSSSANLGGNVTSDGNASVTERGVVYSTSQNPTTANTKVPVGNGLGTFSKSVTGLKDNTTYYVRAYAINSLGTAYSESTTFTTSKILSLATVTTDPVTNIARNGETSFDNSSAVMGGNVRNDGNSEVTERGIVYSMHEDPTIFQEKILGSQDKVIIGSGIGSFSTTIYGLYTNSTYYVRAYAINSQGIVYGENVSFKTIPSLATVITEDATNITNTSATFAGNIIDDGNFHVTERGILYTNSDIDHWFDLESFILEDTRLDYKIVPGSSLGKFSTTISGLITNSIYFYRSYASNAEGTAYGSLKKLMTLEGEHGKFTDSRDGNEYNWIKIGSQIWMAENLAYLPYVNYPSDFSDISKRYYVYAYYGNNLELAKKDRYYIHQGTLYNWTAAMDGSKSSNLNPSNIRGVCPLGWHLPSKSEWEVLENYLIANGFNYDGSLTGNKIAKALASKNWYDTNSPSQGQPAYEPYTNNKSGFSAVLGAGYSSDGFYGGFASWWASTEGYPHEAYSPFLTNSEDLFPYYSKKSDGYSVRCIKD